MSDGMNGHAPDTPAPPLPRVVVEFTPAGKLNVNVNVTVDDEFLALAARCLLQLREQMVARARAEQGSGIVVVPAGVLRGT